jgi:hypothetical protein
LSLKAFVITGITSTPPKDRKRLDPYNYSSREGNIPRQPEYEPIPANRDMSKYHSYDPGDDPRDDPEKCKGCLGT